MSVLKKWLLGTMLLTSCVQADFTKSGDVVTDSVSGLGWQDISGVTNSTTYTHANGITYCEGATTGGYSDWRLPNIYELQSIVDISKSAAPNIYATFAYTASSGYWSSTTYAPATAGAWIVYFGYGDTTYYDKANSYYVRCVRGGQ